MSQLTSMQQCSIVSITKLMQSDALTDPNRAREIIALMYDDLHRVAKQQLSGSTSDATLNATALVHETYEKLVPGLEKMRYTNRRHFLAVAAHAMRQVIIDYARQKHAFKRSAVLLPFAFEDEALAQQPDAEMWLRINSAIEEVGKLDIRLQTIIECRFFAGFSTQEIASILGVTVRTVQRDIKRARAWLIEAISQ